MDGQKLSATKYLWESIPVYGHVNIGSESTLNEIGPGNVPQDREVPPNSNHRVQHLQGKIGKDMMPGTGFNSELHSVNRYAAAGNPEGKGDFLLVQSNHIGGKPELGPVDAPWLILNSSSSSKGEN